MVVNIANHGGPILWEGTYYFGLSDYPNISDWELKKLILFVEYEKKHNRETEIVCEDKHILQAVNYALLNPKMILLKLKPDIISYAVCTECKRKGCSTDFVYHATSIENAKLILKSGSILSSVKAKNKKGEELVVERELSPFKGFKDPLDYYDYIMFIWGNCQVGDKIVMEKLLNRYPNENDLSIGFKPGVRFYFEYKTLMNHKAASEDGVHPVKIKDELSLSDYLFCCIIPEVNKFEFKNIISSNISDKIFYLENDCKDIWEWSEKLYNFVCNH